MSLTMERRRHPALKAVRLLSLLGLTDKVVPLFPPVGNNHLHSPEFLRKDFLHSDGFKGSFILILVAWKFCPAL